MNTNQSPTVLGRSLVIRGELSASEDLLLDGQFEGNVDVHDHSVTVGSNGQVKSEIHARQVIVLGSVTGNISAREKVEIRKTGRVVGDLKTASIAIEDGAYFKGSIEIIREDTPEFSHALSHSTATVAASVED